MEQNKLNKVLVMSIIILFILSLILFLNLINRNAETNKSLEKMDKSIDIERNASKEIFGAYIFQKLKDDYIIRRQVCDLDLSLFESDNLFICKNEKGKIIIMANYVESYYENGKYYIDTIVDIPLENVTKANVTCFYEYGGFGCKLKEYGVD